MLLLLASPFILLAGRLQLHPERYFEIAPTTLPETPPAEVGVCSCMVCNYDDGNWFNRFWNWITGHPPETRLLGGKCDFKDCLTQKRIDAYQNADPPKAVPGGLKKAEDYALANPAAGDDFIKYFMLGQGPTFSDFDTANSFCNYSMGIAVRWYQPSDKLRFIPSNKRAGCYLDNDVLPIYIYKPDASLTPEEQAAFLRQLAKEMEKAGPVTIVPTPEFTSSNAGSVAEQITTIDSECPDCMIAIVPDQTVMPDVEDNPVTTGVDETYHSALWELANSYPAAFENVDMLGLHFFLNDYPDSGCASDEGLYRLMNYSKQALAHYQKPSLLLYYGASAYADPLTGESCTPDQAAAFYDFMHVHIPDMVQAGIVGSAIYQFEDGGTNPEFPGITASTDDYRGSLGLVDAEGNKKAPAFNIVSNRCQFYYNGTVYADNSLKAVAPYSQVPLTFPAKGENTSICTFQSFIATYSNMYLYSEPPKYDTGDSEGLAVIGCDECIGGAPPQKFYSGQDRQRFDPYDCQLYDAEARRESEKCDLDPLLVKAVMKVESDFNPAAISHISGATTPCSGNIGCWKSTPPRASPDSEQPSYRPDSTALPECACGLMQTINDWHDPYFDTVCPSFNPFVPSSSICGGTFKMCDFQSLMRTDAYAGERDAVAGSSDVNLDDKNYRWSEAWLTLLAYNAGPGGVHRYYENWQEKQGCVPGQTAAENPCCSPDFVTYVNQCPLEENGDGGNPYAAKVIATYDSILHTCPSNCEDGVSEVAADPYEGNDYTGPTTLRPPDGSCPYLQNDPNALGYSDLYLGITRPVSGSCSGNFCTDRGTHFHGGIDIGVAVGTEIRAAHAGTVHRLFEQNGAGNYIKLTGDRLTTYYMHIKCNGFAVPDGTYVNEGDLIAYSGGLDSCRGHSFGAHLHFEVRTPDNRRMDPAYFVDTCQLLVSPP
ncbi:MAG: peptidoglycan DD-metalloendopeptidase family protein [Candidatus Micrarchaeia archaeon]